MIILHTSVWGKHHTNFFLRYCLSSILGQTDLVLNLKKINYQYNIFTTSESFNSIIKDKNYIALSKIIDIRFNTGILNEEINKNYNDLQKLNNLCINKTFDEVISKKGAFCWIIPDVIHSNNFLSKVSKSYFDGKRMILAPSHTRCCNEIVDEIESNYKDENHYISISSKNLTKMSFKYICKISAHKNFYNYYNPTFDQQIYYQFKGNFVCHATSPAPIFIYPKTNNVDLTYRGISFEGADILEQMVPNFEDIEIIKDTSILNTIAVEKEMVEDQNVKILNKYSNYNFFNRPFFVNFLSYLLKYKHSNLAIKYFQEPILHRIHDSDVNIDELKLQKPSLFILNVVNVYLKFSKSKFFKKSALMLFYLLRFILRFRRKFFIKDKIFNANKY